MIDTSGIPDKIGVAVMVECPKCGKQELRFDKYLPQPTMGDAWWVRMACPEHIDWPRVPAPQIFIDEYEKTTGQKWVEPWR